MTINWNLPQGWSAAKLGTLALEDSSQVRPADYPSEIFNYWGLEVIDKGQFTEPEPNWVRGAEIASTCVRFDARHVLYSKLRPYLNKVIVPTLPGIGTTEWIVLRPNPGQIDRRYLAYVLRSQPFVSYASDNSAGARMPRARKDAIWSAPIPLPLPNNPARSLEVQRRIVDRLEAVLAEVEESRQLHEKMATDLSRVMEAALTEVFEPLAKAAPSTKTIGSMTTVTSGGTPLRSRPDYFGGAIPWVKTGELKDNTITATEEQITEAAVRETNAKEYPVNTLLVAMYGQGQTRGRTGVLGVRAASNQACCAIYPNADEFDTYYLQFWFRHIRSTLRRESEQRGGNQPNLNQGMIARLKPPLPSTDEQRRFVEYLRQMEETVADMRGTLEQEDALLDALEQSFLSRAFCGEL